METFLYGFLVFAVIFLVASYIMIRIDQSKMREEIRLAEERQMDAEERQMDLDTALHQWRETMQLSARIDDCEREYNDFLRAQALMEDLDKSNG